ncbi:MAG: hypothetical protein NC217_07505 [Muribaculaceae bacterium]|nr:hypothetical protein [Muribaculaceae bacterium]
MSIKTFPPQSPTISEAQEALKRYPYYTLPALMAIKGNPTNGASPLPMDLLQRVALTFSDMNDMPDTLSDRAAIFDNFYPDEQCSTPSTMDTIDTFLSNFGSVDPHDTDALEKLIFSGTPDYGAVLAAEEKNSIPTEADVNDPSLSEQDRLINSFIASTHGSPVPQKQTTPVPQKQTTPAPQQDKKEQTLEESVPVNTKSDKLTNGHAAVGMKVKSTGDTQLTESFVRILVKNRNYSKAIEIISELSLNNPKKSIYFADQIRFLKKLIINENNK